MTNQIRNQRRAEHNQAIVRDLCDIVTDMFLAESKLIHTINYGYSRDEKIQGDEIEQVYDLVKKFIEGLPVRYALGVETPSEVLLHMRLVAAARSEKNKAAVHFTKNLVTICCSDREGLLEYITKLLHENGSRVLDADVMTTADNIVLDRFVVQMNGKLRIDKLQEYIENYLRSSKAETSTSTTVPVKELSRSPLYFQLPRKSKLEDPLQNPIPLKLVSHKKRSQSMSARTSENAIASIFSSLPPSSYDQQTSGQNAKECDCISVNNSPPSTIPTMRRREPVNRDAFHFDDNDSTVETDSSKPDKKRGMLSSILSEQNPQVIALDDIILTDVLGSGRNSQVYKATWKNKNVALKVATSPTAIDELKREADISSLLSHPNVSKLLGVCEDEDTFCLAHEYCEGGSLQSFMRDTSKYYEYLPIALDICNGMAYLHSRNVIHRDLKPSNILLTGDYRAKVSDFGISITHTGKEELTAETGTYRWMAPEVIRHESYSSNADVYSFGILLWQLVTREVVPFANMSPIQTAYAVANGHRPKIPKNVPKKLKRIIESCWEEDAQKRPSFTYIAMALADYAQMAFHPSNVGAQTVRIANEMLANVEGNATVNVDFTTSVFSKNMSPNIYNCADKLKNHRRDAPVSTSFSSAIGIEI